MENRDAYVQRYYDLYSSGSVDTEMVVTGSFLTQYVTGVVLDCGSGPVPQLWSIFMAAATEIHAIDLPPESTAFVREKLKTVDTWWSTFTEYQKIVEDLIGSQDPDYIRTQIRKLKSMQQADMAVDLPFPDAFFDTVVSLYSLGCLKDTAQLERAISNIHRVLKPGGKLLHINTDGQNRNDVIPAYTWNGLDQSAKEITRFLENLGYTNIETNQVKLPKEASSMYRYGIISTLIAVSPN